jgi:CRP-like cAMP-binding protein
MVSSARLCPCELFRGLRDAELQQLAAIAREKDYQAGDLICTEREQAERVFILCEGRVQIQVQLRSLMEPDARLTLEEIEPGRIFGWSSLVRQRQFTATVQALEPVRVIAIRAEDLNNLFARNAHIGFVVMKNLAEIIASRLRNTREQCGQR